MATRQVAHWSDSDVKALIDFLVSELPSAGDGITFKAAVWTEAAIAVNKVVKTKGANKTASSCKNKFNKLREIYNIVAKIKSQSGFTWDDKKGANIDETSAAVWEAYEKVRKNKGSAPFRNKGWVWFNEVQPLMPTMARGANAFRATQSSQAQSVPAPISPTSEDVGGTFDSDEPEPIRWVCLLHFFKLNYANVCLLIVFITITCITNTLSPTHCSPYSGQTG
ncbi:hypothetical protein CPC08DRAFT_696454 [Agrocybe pediades]|nr:hypothetical protein CPC08DRAFT_696454 [Agrocybe pediades]